MKFQCRGFCRACRERQVAHGRERDFARFEPDSSGSVVQRHWRGVCRHTLEIVGNRFEIVLKRSATFNEFQVLQETVISSFEKART